ncbi:MAG: cation:proton antiporter [Muribaculaceae bacterium]
MILAAIVTHPIPIFFIVMLIILLGPLLLNRLRIPHIIGMIVAGVVIGPFGCDVLHNDESFRIFGQVGLLYLMFLAGLEIDMYHLRLNLRRGLFFGLLTLAVPLAAGILTAMYVQKLDLAASLLLGAMYAAHTLIAYPVAARYGITRAPAVVIAVVGTIIAVIGSLMVIALAVSIGHDGSADLSDILLLLLRMALWAGVLFFLYPKVTRWFFRNFSDRVNQYVFIMAMVFLAAWTASLIGLEGILGAFLAGLVLNRYVPAASPLMTSIEFVGNALFIPYFLISVGMMINLRVVGNVDTLIAAGIMLTVGIAAKWLPAYITQKVNGLDPFGRKTLFGLTVAHTAVALAVVTLGNEMGLLSETILNATILVILITCSMAPIITANAAPKLKIAMMSDDESMTQQTRVNNTLIAVSNPLTAPQLVELGVLMRNTRSHRFYAIHVRNDNSPSAKAMSANALALAKSSAAAADIAINEIERYDLNTVTGVLNALAERDITEVIVGMHRRSAVIDSFYGTKIEQLLQSTNRMVLISRIYMPLNTIARICVAVPRSAQYESGFARWVRCLARLTRQLGCRIIFCCHPEQQPLIREIIVDGSYGIRTEFRTVESLDSLIMLTARVHEEDLLVVISAREHSVSHTDEVTELPGMLQRNYARNNLLVIYPEQFGEDPTHLTSIFHH